MPLKVLYLDDEEGLCENFFDEFSSEHISVTTFTDHNKAMEAAKNNPPDLIFIDHRLPSTTGDKVALALDPKIPKILITGDISVETVYKFEKIVSKPYSAADVLDLLNSYLKRKNSPK